MRYFRLLIVCLPMLIGMQSASAASSLNFYVGAGAVSGTDGEQQFVTSIGGTAFYTPKTKYSIEPGRGVLLGLGSEKVALEYRRLEYEQKISAGQNFLVTEIYPTLVGRWGGEKFRLRLSMGVGKVKFLRKNDTFARDQVGNMVGVGIGFETSLRATSGLGIFVDYEQKVFQNAFLNPNGNDAFEIGFRNHSTIFGGLYWRFGDIKESPKKVTSSRNSQFTKEPRNQYR